MEFSRKRPITLENKLKLTFSKEHQASVARFDALLKVKVPPLRLFSIYLGSYFNYSDRIKYVYCLKQKYHHLSYFQSIKVVIISTNLNILIIKQN